MARDAIRLVIDNEAAKVQRVLEQNAARDARRAEKIAAWEADKVGQAAIEALKINFPSQTSSADIIPLKRRAEQAANL